MSERIKILIVDDIETNRSLIRQTLNALYDFDIVEASDGEEAVEQFETENPDLILMDIMMPGVDGCKATTLIKEKTGDDYTPIIFLTALNSDDSLVTALSSGGDDFVSKPYNIGILQSKINVHLKIRELTTQLNSKNNMLSRFNTRLIQEQELIEYFFENAIKQSFLDKKIVNYHMSSISVFNGDVMFVQRGPKGSIYVIVGDFTGHGLTAAMGTLPVAMIFFTMVEKGAAVGEIAREINKQLFKLLPYNMFLVASILELNSREEMLTVWTSGMPDGYIFNGGNQLTDTIYSQHMPLGIIDNNDFDSIVQVYHVEEGGKVYLCSDGVVEARNVSGEMFGEERYKDTLVDGGDHRFNKILDDLKLFVTDVEQSDDITLVELNCLKLPELPPPETKAISDALQWSISISLSATDMRKQNPISKLFDILNSLPSVYVYRDVLHILISEIYNNSLDHSILNLDSAIKSSSEDMSEYYKLRDEQIKNLENAFIDFNFSFLTKQDDAYLKIEVKDSGRGYQGKEQEFSAELFSGRGLDIIKNFCEEMSFSEDGSVFTVLYRL